MKINKNKEMISIKKFFDPISEKLKKVKNKFFSLEFTRVSNTGKIIPILNPSTKVEIIIIKI